METIIYAAVSANGLVLLASADNYQTPVALLQDCIGLAHQTGNIVIGRKTYQLFYSNPNAKEIFKGIEVVVLSQGEKEIVEGVTFLDNISSVMQFYKDKGYSKIFVAGGAYTYQSFINSGHVDELYLNYIPLLTGNGTPLVSETDINKNFQVVDSKAIADNIIQVHYKAVK
jgi:dihydrofolate reductase